MDRASHVVATDQRQVMDEDKLLANIGCGLGSIAALVAFFGSWIYCVSEYGYLMGFGLGWLPSLILAAIVFLIVRYLWWLALLGGIILFLANR